MKNMSTEVTGLNLIDEKLYAALEKSCGGLQREVRGLFGAMLREFPDNIDDLRGQVLLLSQPTVGNYASQRDTILSALWARIDNLQGRSQKEEYLDRLAVAFVRGDIEFDEYFVDFVTESASAIELSTDRLDEMLREHFCNY